MANSVGPVESTRSPFALLNLDVLKTICDAVELSSIEQPTIKALDGLSLTNRLLRNVCLPSILRVVHIRGDWDHAMTKVREMLDDSALGAYVKCDNHIVLCKLLYTYYHVGRRTFKFVLHVHEEAQHPPPEQLAPTLTRLLTRLQRVEKLVLVIPEHHINIFSTEIAKAGFSLPTVRTLVVGPFCDFAVSLCPNVDTISSNGWVWLHPKSADRSARTHTRRLIAAVGEVGVTLKRFEMMERWTVDLVEGLHDALPNLPRLSLYGGSYRGGIAAFIPVLSRFECLEYLALSGPSKLGVGFEPPRCRNAYSGPHGEALRERVKREGEEANAKVANMVALACAKLKELWIGESTRVEILRDEQGGFRDIVLHQGKRGQVVYYPSP